MKKKRWLAALLALVMTLALAPIAAFAAAETVTVENGINFSPETTTQDIEEAWGEGTATIEANSDGSYTVTLLKNITLRQGATLPVTFGIRQGGAEQPMMILDLNGCVLSGKTIVVSNYGNLTIEDSVGSGKIVYDGGQYLTAVQNAGYTLIINGGSFECYGASTATNGGAISGAMTTTTIINGGSFYSQQSGALTTYGSMIINGGDISGAYGIVAKQPSSVGDPASSIEIPSDSTAVVNVDNMAFVVITDGDGEKTEGSIMAQGGTYNAPTVVGRTGGGDVTNNVDITGGKYTADPSGYVKDNAAVAEIIKSGSETGTFMVGAAITSETNGLGEGDTITIKSGSIELVNVPDDITVKNEGVGTVKVNGVALEQNSEIVTHTHQLVYTPPKAATCNEEGNIEYWYCESCKKYFSDETCTTEIESSQINIEAKGHTFGTEWEFDAENHWNECECGEKANVTAHTFQWITDKKATATEAGLRHEECSVCRYAKAAEIIPAIGTSDEEKTDNTMKTDDATVPQTGENNSMWLWIALLLLSGTVLTGTIAYSRKGNRSR